MPWSAHYSALCASTHHVKLLPQTLDNETDAFRRAHFSRPNRIQAAMVCAVIP
jgi:hypothetical protein